jgi:Holliday junction DNA helicase RuvA
VLSGLSVDDLAAAVAARTPGGSRRFPGIGKKTAERLVLELRDKLPKLTLGVRAGRPRGERRRRHCAAGPWL